LLKNVYFQFTTANINLFLNAYYYQDYERLYKSFLSVSLSISIINVLKTHGKLFLLYKYEKWSFEKKWKTYKQKKILKKLEKFGLENETSLDEAPKTAEEAEKLQNFIEMQENLLLEE
jgi:hypothetical protein